MKVLWVLLAVVLAAFIALLVVGGRDDRADLGVVPDWTTWLEQLMVRRNALYADDVVKGCLSGGVALVVPGGTCHVRIRVSDSMVRQARVTLDVGVRAEVRLVPRGEMGAPVRVPLRSAAPRSPSLVVLGDGADLYLTCLVSVTTQPCLFRLE